MNETDKPPGLQPRPRMTERAAADHAARQTREAAALRENLRKRKLQARGRADDANVDPSEQP